jgi:hypothetical protein
MAVNHAFSNAVADAAGTMTVWFGATTATVAASDVVRPSDWNSAHNQVVTLSGNTAGAAVLTGTNIVFGGSNNVTLSGIQGANAATINVSAADDFLNVSAGTTSNNLTAVTFSNLNGISFGLNASTITASYTVPTITNSSFTVTDSATSGTVARLALTNLNGVTLSLSTGAGGSHTIVGSHNALTSQSNQNVTAANGGFAFQTLSFSNINGVSFGTSAGSAITASVSAQTGGIYVTAQSTGQSSSSTYDVRTLSFVPDGIISAGWSNGSFRVSATQSNQAFSAAGGSSAFQTLGFSDNGYASWTNTNGSVALTEIRCSLFAASNTTQSSSGTQNIDALSIAGAGGVSVGVTNGSVVISGLLGTVNQTGPNIGVSNLGNTAGSTGTVSTGNVVFAGSNGITLSQSTGGAGSNATITVLGMGNMMSSHWGPDGNNLTFVSAPVNASASVNMFQIPYGLSGTRIELPVYQSVSSSAVANTYGQQWSIYMAIMSNDTANSRLVSLSSGSTQTTYTLASNTAGQTQIIGSGVRPISCPVNFSMTPGQYFIAANWVTNTFSSGTATTALNRTVSVLGNPVQSASFAMVGDYSVATAATNNSFMPAGVFSAASTGLPGTISYSQMTMTGASRSQANFALLFRG